MNGDLLFWRALVVAGVVDWLLVRSITRVAIFIPMPPTMAALFRLLDTAGQVATSLVGVLAFVVLGRIAWREGRERGGRLLAACLLGLAGLSLLFLFVPATGAPALVSHLLYVVAIILLLVRAAPRQAAGARRHLAGWMALLVPALALLAGRLHQAIPVLYATLRWPGPLPFTALLFALGELLVVLGALALWWAYGRQASPRAWALAALPAGLFAALYSMNAAMSGILAIWSTGLTLYLPWPLYAIAIWLAGVTLLASRPQGDGIQRDGIQHIGVAWAILLLAAGGYAPQLSVHAFLGLIALYLLTGRGWAVAEEVPGDRVAPVPARAW